MEEIPVIGDVRGLGLMIGVELVQDQRTRKPAPEIADKVKAIMGGKGFLIGVGGLFKNVLRLQPPLVIDSETTARAGEALIASVKQAITS
jgi:4-aminobutyrate aminotransferase/(S)-3-amino-2-methylpropionate transaminase